MINNKRVAIIILNYKTYELTLNLVDRILTNHVITKNDTIIVIDNNSPNESRQVLSIKEKKYNYVFIANKENNGYSSGNNIGLRYAFNNGYKYALILNNDVYFHSNPNLIINELIRGFIDDSIATVSPLIMTPKYKIIPHFRRTPTFINLSILYPINRIFDYLLYKPISIQQIYKPSGCCMFVSLDHMDKIEFFDENVFLYSEEEILAEKLKIHNLKSVSNANVTVIHNHSETIKSAISKKSIQSIKLKSYEYYLKQYLKFGRFKLLVAMFIKKIILNIKG